MRESTTGPPLPMADAVGSPSKAGLAWSACVGATALLTYLVLTSPVSGDKDASEFTLVLATLGLAHPTGYPLYTVLGHLFVRAGHGCGLSWAHAAGAWSALGGGIAVGLLHQLATTLLPEIRGLSAHRKAVLCLPPVLLLAGNPIWTVETTLAEVYSWHVAWVAASSLLFVRLVRGALLGEAPTARSAWRAAAAWGGLCGLGLAHHATAVLVAVPLSLVLTLALIARRQLRLRLLAMAVAAAVLPMASYAYVAWRAFHPARVQWPFLAESWAGTWAHVTGAAYSYLLGHFNPSGVQVAFLRHYVYPFLGPCVALLAAGTLVAQDTGKRLTLGGLLAVAVLQTTYAFSYGAYDPGSYFLPALAIGLAALPTAVGQAAVRLKAAGRLLGVAMIAGALLAVALIPGWLRTGSERRQGYVRFDSLVRLMWESIPLDNAIVFWADDMVFKLREIQILEGSKPGIEIVHPLNLIDPHARTMFLERHGFDPLAGTVLPVRSQMFRAGSDTLITGVVTRMMENINERTDRPVILFLPQAQSVRLLTKPGVGPSGGTGSGVVRTEPGPGRAPPAPAGDPDAPPPPPEGAVGQAGSGSAHGR